MSTLEPARVIQDPVFGPVDSRRFGKSLGMNPLPAGSRVCNFDRIYCECATGASLRVLLLESEPLENLRVRLTDRQRLVTRHTILRDRLSAVVFMVIVMAAEASGELIVTEIIGVGAPGNHHPGKNVARVYPFHRGRCLLNKLLPCQGQDAIPFREWNRPIEVTRFQRRVNSREIGRASCRERV